MLCYFACSPSENWSNEDTVSMPICSWIIVTNMLESPLESDYVVTKSSQLLS
jgi:hypothetical protein